MFAIAYYTNMVYPVLDIIEEAKADKEHFHWMLKVIGRDLVTNLILIAGWSWYVEKIKTSQVSLGRSSSRNILQRSSLLHLDNRTWQPDGVLYDSLLLFRSNIH